MVEMLIPKDPKNRNQNLEDPRELLLAFIKAVIILQNKKDKEPSLPEVLDFKMEITQNIYAAGSKKGYRESTARKDTNLNQEYLKIAEIMKPYKEIRVVFEKFAESSEIEQMYLDNVIEEALLPFKNTGLQERTRESSFHPSILRGVLTQECLEQHGLKRHPETEIEWQIIRNSKKPLEWQGKSIFLGTGFINQKRDVVGTLNALFLEACGTYLTDNQPHIMDSTGIVLGPYQTLFVLDNLSQLKRIPSLAKNIGREKETDILYLITSILQVNRNFPITSEEEKRTPMLETTRILPGLEREYSPEECLQIENGAKAKIILGEQKPGIYFILTKEFPDQPIYIHHSLKNN